MEMRIVGKNAEVSQSTQDYIHKRLDKLSRYLPEITEAKVEIREEKTKSPQHRFTTQVTINIKDTVLRCEESGENIFTTVDTAAEILARQIKRYKGKSHGRMRDNSLAYQAPALEEAVDEGDETTPGIVKVKRFAVKPMPVSEAIEQMELLSHNFFLFMNADNNSINLLYRRNDGNYGLIEPEQA